MTTVAEVLVETLELAGVKRIYGIVGDSLNGITNALLKRNTIRWIHTRHEEVAAFAAGAESQLTGELCVCAGSCGPGNVHLINGLYDCQRSRTPVLAIAAHNPTAEAQIIQIDIDGEQLGKRTDISLGLVGDIQPTLEALIPLLTLKQDTQHL